MRSWFVLTASIMFLLTLNACSSDDDGAAPGTLSGTVLGSPTPVDGATVTIVELTRETRTSATGFFEFTSVPAGSYTVIVDGAEVFDPNDSTVRLPRKAIIEFPNVTVGGIDRVLNDRPIFLPTLDEGTQVDTG